MTPVINKSRRVTAHSVIKKKAQEGCPVARTPNTAGTPNAAPSGLTGLPSPGNGRAGSRALTQLPDLQDLTQHLGELNRAAAKGALVLVFSATVLQDNLQGRRGREGGRGEAGDGVSAEGSWPQPLPGCRCPGGISPSTACCPRPASRAESG